MPKNDGPLSVADLVASSLHAVQVATRRSIRDAMHNVGDQARKDIMSHAAEVPGSDRKFSGTDRHNKGRLGVKIRYDQDTTIVRVSPNGPWGLPAGRGGRKSAYDSWDKGEREARTHAEKVVPKIITTQVEQAFLHGR